MRLLLYLRIAWRGGMAGWRSQLYDEGAIFFHIDKGIEDITENASVNEFVPDEDHRVLFSRMVYFSDGSIDIPCMKLVKNLGGHSIVVYNNKTCSKKNNTLKLLEDGRVNFTATADYSEGSNIHKYTIQVIDEISVSYEIFKLEKREKQIIFL